MKASANEAEVTRSREVYYYDYAGEFGLGGLAGPPVSDDCQLGRDAGLLLGSELSDHTLRAALLAVPHNDSDVRGWLSAVALECPADGPERDPDEAHALNRARPTVSEHELRALVATEIQEVAPFASECGIPSTVAALLRVVEEVDADLGLRLFLRTAKEYSVPMTYEQYERLLRIGHSLAYPTAATFAGLNVRWPPLDPGRRDFAAVSLGLPRLAGALHGTDWQYEGSAADILLRVLTDEPGVPPGSMAAVLLEDVRRLLDSALPDATVSTLWRAVAHRTHAVDAFDAHGSRWLSHVAATCESYLHKVAPRYVPFVSPARTEAKEAVLREISDMAAALRDAMGEGGSSSLKAVVTEVDAELGFRLFLRTLLAYDLSLGEAARIRHRALGLSFGHCETY
ncbi:hypothetical protein ACFUJY_34590 [Streptomyces sp. NPDC057249]|uniref:hypothetical protein n=1 Tax=Streptomyces sp. NPDC057249 TaxID=3346067 RepID=UPI00362D8960